MRWIRNGQFTFRCSKLEHCNFEQIDGQRTLPSVQWVKMIDSNFIYATNYHLFINFMIVSVIGPMLCLDLVECNNNQPFRLYSPPTRPTQEILSLCFLAATVPTIVIYPLNAGLSALTKRCETRLHESRYQFFFSKKQYSFSQRLVIKIINFYIIPDLTRHFPILCSPHSKSAQARSVLYIYVIIHLRKAHRSPWKCRRHSSIHPSDGGFPRTNDYANALLAWQCI